MIVDRKTQGETVEVKFSPNAKHLVRIEGNTTRIYDLADEVIIRTRAGIRLATTVTPANRTWKFGMGGIATIRG